MKKWEVRTNCEFVTEVEAENEEQAILKATAIDVMEWNKAWATVEVEELEGVKEEGQGHDQD